MTGIVRKRISQNVKVLRFTKRNLRCTLRYQRRPATRAVRNIFHR